LNFGYRCVQRFKEVFSSVGASSEDVIPSSEDISNTFKHIEGEVDALDEVIAGHGDFCVFASFSRRSCCIAEDQLHACEDSKQTNLRFVTIRFD
jgi:hypothetical protein